MTDPTMHNDDRPRPDTNQAGSCMSSIATDAATVPPDADVVRCRRCRHPLTAATSVRLELGPTCRRLELWQAA